MPLRSLAALFDLVLPPLCLLCREAPAAELALCAASRARELALCAGCRARLDLLDPRAPACARCGRPNPVPYPSGRCSDCLARAPSFARAASAARYGGAAREALLAFKLRHDAGAAWLLDDLLDRAVGALCDRHGARLGDVSAVVPVPSHRDRVRSRGFAPVTELARSLARRARVPLRASWIERVRAGAPQGDPSTRSRRANVSGAFAPTGRRAPFAPRTPLGLRVLLIDDVFTSGSTARECARALRAAGAREVLVATVARGGLGPGAVLSPPPRERAANPPDLPLPIDADAF